MGGYNAFAGFPESGAATEIWELGSTDKAGRFLAFPIRERTKFGVCLQENDPVYPYPRICKVESHYIGTGKIVEPGYVYLTPGSVILGYREEATLRFKAPREGRYRAELELRAGELAYAGPSFRLYTGQGKEVVTARMPYSYGHHREFTGVISLAKGETLSLSIGPSANGDNTSDSTLVHFGITPVPSALPVLTPIVAALLALSFVLAIWYWRKLRIQKH